MNQEDPTLAPPSLRSTTSEARRRATLAALFGLAAVGGPARAQMGGPGGPGGGGRGMPDGPRPDRDTKDKDAHDPERDLPRDLVAAFARRLREGVPELALAPPQQAAWRDFVGALTEVGQHNERRLQRILWHTSATVSAAAPLKTFIAAEVDEGDGRQQALVELQGAYVRLDALLDPRQRDVLTKLFVATRSELQAPPAR